MSEMMWAARLQKTGQPLVVEKITVPKPGPGELLVRLEASGICHTDLHVLHGADFPEGAPQPLTLGHEGIGKVVDKGPGTNFAIGMRVGAPWLHDTCGHCRSCLTGRESYCPSQLAHGYTAHGTYAEYVIVKESFAAPIPARLDACHAAPLLCAGITAFGGVEKADLAPGKVAVILGCGGLGQYGIQLARLAGARVIAIDVSADKLDQARLLGAEACILADEQAADKVKALGGADAVLNFAPTHRIWPLVTGMVNNFATIVSVAMVEEPVPLMLEWLTFNGVNITGTSVGTRQQMLDFLALADRHDLNIDTETVHLADINQALTRLARGNVRGRLVIDFAAA
jgi:propanol-preferring alcohol dehydrogenase